MIPHLLGSGSHWSFRRQVILIFVVGFFLLIAAFSIYQVRNESTYLYHDSTDETISLAASLAASSRSWVLARDVAGMQEIVQSFQNHPQLRYAMIMSLSGLVLAHTDPTKVGQFLADAQGLMIIKSPPVNRILVDNEWVSEVAVPIMVDNRHVGWAMIAQGRENIVDNLRKRTLDSALFVLMSVALSLFAALLIANRLGSRIGDLMKVAEKVQVGNFNTRVVNIPDSDDEISKLSKSLNMMLDALGRNEEQLRITASVFESTQEGILITDANNNIIDANAAFTIVTGYSREEVLGKNPKLLRSGRQDKAFYAKMWQSLEQNKAWRGEIWNRRKSGELYAELLSISVICNNDGKVVRHVGVFSDISQLKEHEAELTRYKDHLEEEVQTRTADLVLARDAAEAANKAKSAFLSSISHELRTPLNAILGFSGLMRQNSSLTQEQSQNLAIINRSGEHLLTLVNDVLDMAKIEAGRVQLENIPFDLGAMVRDVTDMMDIRAKEKGLRLLIEQSSLFPRFINGDEARLRQILINLVGNAIKFTQQGGVTIRLGSKQNEILHLLIEVEDSGPGIDPEDQQRLFQPFVQLGKQADNKGTGLGLAITRQFVQLMGGSINLESAPGKGALFRVELPLNEVKDEDIAKSQEAKQSEVSGLAPGQAVYRILIVEDQLENQLLLTQLMERIGFAVKIAENGEQGVQLFQSWQPRLIWMDRRMPVMDGLEATRRIRALPGGKEVKIVAVTASAFKEQRDEMLDAGMDDFIRKPYRFNEIYECLSRQLGVQYTYTAAQGNNEISLLVELTPEMLALLPPELRSALHDALESLEGKRISAVIQQVEAFDMRLHTILSDLVDNFDYPAILKALQKKEM